MFTIKRKVPLAPLTTFHVGGNAEYFSEVCGALELADALEYADHHHLPVFILGGGSNVLFSDKGFPGLVIRMNDGGIKVSGERIIGGAGVKLWDVVQAAQQAGLQGMENLAGIPGSLGGAVRGNAGAFGMEIGSAVASVKALMMDTGLVKEFSQAECDFGYRSSFFKKRNRFVVLSVELKLKPGEPNELARTIRETVSKREAKHSQTALCAGSFFTNPVVTDEKLREEFEKDNGVAPKDDKLPAGWIIDHCGLRGKRIGGAMVSDRHPNYLLNTGNATAEDIVMLTSFIKTRVRDTLGIRLNEEVQMVGF